MPLLLTLLGGSELPTSARPGDEVAALRRELAEKRDLHPASVQLLHEGKTLLDGEAVPDGNVSVVLSLLPWLDDGSGRIQDKGGGEVELAAKDAKGGAKFNALCDVGFSGGQEYFEVEVLGGDGTWVGISTKAGFGGGYHMKGLFFGGPGNLADGSALVRSSHGEPVVAGSVVGVSLDLTDPDVVGVTFWQCGRCLGPAFEASRSSPGDTVYPVVSMKESGDRCRISLRCQARDVKELAPAHPAEGTWRLQRLGHGPDLSEVALDDLLEQGFFGKAKGKGKGKDRRDVILDVRRQDRQPGDAADDGVQRFSLRVRICNSLNAIAKATPAEQGRDALEVGPVMGTRMMGAPGLMELEGIVQERLPQATAWLASGSCPADGSLLITGPECEMAFVRQESPHPEPVSHVSLP